MNIPFIRKESESEHGVAVFSLTPLGKEKADRFAGEGGAFHVLAALNERGPSTVGEISRAAGMSYDKAKAVMKQLMKQGYVGRAH